MNEIRLLGQRIKVIVPGKSGDSYKNKYIRLNWPTIDAGDVYYGYSMKDIHGSDFSFHQAYIEVKDNLYQMSSWECFSYPIDHYIEEVQSVATMSNIRKIALYLYDRVEKLEDKLDKMME